MAQATIIVMECEGCSEQYRISYEDDYYKPDWLYCRSCRQKLGWRKPRGYKILGPVDTDMSNTAIMAREMQASVDVSSLQATPRMREPGEEEIDDWPEEQGESPEVDPEIYRDEEEA